ncbi:MAG: hypothetical protein FD147_657 [Chloroflexi bacterium]|nr:MAG: hypothetical protein FD147_657 [Chloroflexota bacterium]
MSNTNSTETVLFIKPTRTIVVILLVVFLLLGVGVRLIDFTDLPLDFAATRQLHSLIMARGLYYQMDTPETNSMSQDYREFGIITGKSEPVIEPPVFENLVALTYRLVGGENILIPRVYSILFWVIGGIPLFFLSRRLMTVNGAFAALAVYLFTPFGVFGSRSFQPDPMMVMWMIWALYYQVKWAQEQKLGPAILAGIFTGIAIFIKGPAAFFVGIPLAGLVLSTGFKKWIKNKHVYLMAFLALLPALSFNIISATIGGNAGSIFGTRFFPELFLDPKWYVKWLLMIKSVVNYFPLVIGLLAFFLIKTKQDRIFYFCLWLGYLLYGFMFAYHIYTHNYYHLPLIPILALGFGYGFSIVFEKLEEINRHWLARVSMMVILIFSLGLCLLKIRGDLIASSYRHEAQYWTELGEKIGGNASVIALTHDYGYRISYWGHVNPKLWPTAGDRTIKTLVGATDPAFLQLFKELTTGKGYFLVTLIGELDKQPDLKDYLFKSYPYQAGDGYYLFDLDHPLLQIN